MVWCSAGRYDQKSWYFKKKKTVSLYMKVFFFMHNQVFTAFSTGLERDYKPLLDRVAECSLYPLPIYPKGRVNIPSFPKSRHWGRHKYVM